MTPFADNFVQSELGSVLELLLSYDIILLTIYYAKMKQYLLLFFCTITFYAIATAQELEEVDMDMSLGNNNGFILDLPEYDYKFATQVWKDYLKEFRGKTKRVKRSSELFTDDATISYMSSNSVDLYSKIDRSGSGCALNIWFDLGGAFLDSENHGEAREGVDLFLNGYQKKLKVGQIKNELSGEQKELKSLEGKLAKLQSLNDRYHKEIENWKEKIAANEDKIKTNINDQSDMENAIGSQKDKVKDVEVKLAKAEN